MKETSILFVARELLLARKVTYEKIAADTGLSVWWLAKFAQGRIENPSVKRIEILHTYLRGRQ